MAKTRIRMIKTSINKIKKIARELAQNKKSWHFHILTPTCQLNTIDQYALIVENSTDKKTYVCYSDKPYMGVGEIFVKLLHGDDVMQDKEKAEELSDPSPTVKELIKRAKKLNQEGKFWHHHMLFPDCIFNDSGKWLILFEDQEKGEVLKGSTNSEPKSDLKHIETLFYNQKRKS